jgi:serine/threonine-protein kinase
LDKRTKPAEAQSAGGQDVDTSLSDPFAQNLESEMDTESLLADLVAGIPDFQAQIEEAEESPLPPSAQHKPEPVSSNGRRGNEPSSLGAGAYRTAIKTQPRIFPTENETRKIGRYLIEQEIGKGVAGSVFKARDPKLDRTVAIKTIRYRLGQPGTDIVASKERIYREARAIAKLNHPNLVVVHDVDEASDLCYVVMEYLEGTDLRMVLDQEHRLEWERAIDLMIQVCNGLEYVHRLGIIHLDIKPANLIFQRDTGTLKVTDFSIDKINQQTLSVHHSGESGAHLYLAPEQRNGFTPFSPAAKAAPHSTRVDSRADIFSMGVVLYEMLTGEPPCVDEHIDLPVGKIARKSYVPPSLQNIELPVEVDDVVARALSVNPEQRYQTAAEFREALVQLQTSVLLR